MPRLGAARTVVVIPAQAGIQASPFAWTPAFAGVTPEFLASETGCAGQDSGLH